MYYDISSTLAVRILNIKLCVKKFIALTALTCDILEICGEIQIEKPMIFVSTTCDHRLINTTSYRGYANE